MFSRDELIELRKRAEDMAQIEGLNPHWMRAYLQLADAADRLDAMIARTQEKENEGEPTSLEV